jgi:AraC-like DNA-binding protein
LFEATGASFSQTVTAGRIEPSCRLLIEAPARTISQIAFASGFDSLATFYRAFHAVEGMSPGDSGNAPVRGERRPVRPKQPNPADSESRAGRRSRFDREMTTGRLFERKH